MKDGKNNADLFTMLLNGVDTSPFAVHGAASKYASEEQDPWHMESEGQLTVDVVDTKHDLVVISTVAGAPPKNIEIFINDDMLSIRGSRRSPVEKEDIQKVYHEECFWGPFSRTIVLPVHVAPSGARSVYERGLLTIYLPKVTKQEGHSIPIEVVDE